MGGRTIVAIVLALGIVASLGMAAVPARASTGSAGHAAGAVSLPSSAATALPTPVLTLTYGGLAGGFITRASAALGHRVRIHGTVTPIAVRVDVTIRVQKYVARHWVTKMTVTRRVDAPGTYSWRFLRRHRGIYRADASVPPSAAYQGATTGFPRFRGYQGFAIG